MDLAIVIVNWNVADLLRRCLLSLRAAIDATGLETTVIVVDNASTDNSVAMLRVEFPWVQIIVSPTNVGFTRGNNLGLRALGFTDSPPSPVSTGPLPLWDCEACHRLRVRVRALDPASANTDPHPSAPSPIWGEGGESRDEVTSPLPRYVLLLNPDTEVPRDGLTTMLAYMDTHPQVGLLGPRMRYGDGSAQSTRRRFPTLATGLLESTILQRWWPNVSALQYFYMLDQPDDAIQEVDWVVGACMLTRREALAQVGLLDEGFFMYSEEVDWARRFKAAGWQVVYLPTVEILHYEGRSSEQVVAQRHIHFQTSKVRYFRKWHGPVVGEALRAFLLLTYVVQIGEEAAKWLLGHKRPLRAERIEAYGRVLRSGLRR